MAIEFPNLSRRYDATRRCVRFSGYDGALEKSFFVEERAIWHLDMPAQKDEQNYSRPSIVIGSRSAR
jgi:hypothetical protein